MRTRFDNRMVAHLWANRAQSEGHSENMRFDGPSIFSYAAEIARHVYNSDGQHAVLFNSNKYSVTTSHHQSLVMGAIPSDVKVFQVTRLDTTEDNHSRNWQNYLFRLEQLAVRIKHARTYKDLHKSQFSETVVEANAYSEFFGLEYRISGDFLEIVTKIQEDRERLAAETQARLEREQIERDQRMAGDVERWKNGEDVRIDCASKVYLRIQGDAVETSLGAEFPVRHAKLAFTIVKDCHDQQKEWEPNGHSIHLGYFTVDRIEANGDVKAGCHKVGWDEIERIAKQIYQTEEVTQ